VEAQKDLQTYLEQGRTALAEGHGREAAFAFAHGIQLEPENLAAHLGLAEANLAIPGNEAIVRRACQQIFDLQPESGTESKIAEVLLDVLDKRYDNGLNNIVAVVQADPGNLYAHALHSYLLRATGQDYDAQQVMRRVRRQSSGKSFENCFPPLIPHASNLRHLPLPAKNRFSMAARLVRQFVSELRSGPPPIPAISLYEHAIISVSILALLPMC